MKFLIFLLLSGGVAYAEQAYQVCGRNVQTKVVACEPLPLSKADAEATKVFMDGSMADNGLDRLVKFKVRKFSNKDVVDSPGILYPKQAPKPVATPEPDQKV